MRDLPWVLCQNVTDSQVSEVEQFFQENERLVCISTEDLLPVTHVEAEIIEEVDDLKDDDQEEDELEDTDLDDGIEEFEGEEFEDDDTEYSTGGGRGKGRDSDHDSCRPRITGRLHSNAYEALSEHESSDDDESTVGRRGPVAPTPLPEPRNREWIWIRHDQFSNQDKATRTIGEILQAMWCHPWKSWKDVSSEDADRMARESAKAAANKAGVDVGSDFSVIIPYKPRWMRAEFWEPLVQSWNTPEWKAKSSQNTSNRAKFVGGKHTLGSQTYATLKLKADEKLGRPATVDELWMQSHAKKGTRPLDRLLRRERGEGSKEPEEINFQDNVEWVDAKAKESFKSYQKYVMEKYGDNTSKQPLFDLDTWIQAGKKKGRFDISDPQVLMTGTQATLGTSTYLPARNEEKDNLTTMYVPAKMQQAGPPKDHKMISPFGFNNNFPLD
ncbi:hypothetical protein E3N88_01515 [Mikania micrantha]|uniref:Uncharacterized protein n=1 Tax=Mikania micrantha TaxID=192012 RepID=A0A5N6Q1A4_9ASTR|nr:hypothetical protein E3N88_01515 [Mikania micrantha]